MKLLKVIRVRNQYHNQLIGIYAKLIINSFLSFLEIELIMCNCKFLNLIAYDEYPNFKKQTIYFYNLIYQKEMTEINKFQGRIKKYCL